MRQVLAALAALLVLGAAVGVAVVTLEGRDDGRAQAEAPDATVDAYLDAWADGDHDAMLALVRDPPETFVADHAQLREGLDVATLSIERLDLVEDVDGRATAQAEVTAEVPEIGPVSWPIELRVLRERGRWGVAWSPAALHPAWRPGARFVTTVTSAERAPILARDGTELAGPGERVTYGFEPAAIADRAELVAAFEDAIPGSGATAERLLSRGGLVDGWFYPVVSLSTDQAGEVGRELGRVPGVLRRTEDGARNLLADGFAVHVVGRTGEATAEELDRLGPPYGPGDVVGRTGLEAVLERRLAPREQVQVELRDGTDGPVQAVLATGTRAREGDPTAVTGGPVTTTVDVRVQRAVENALLGRGSPTAIVVVDAEGGAIRAAASRPFDGFNRAFEGRYAPGVAIAPVVVDALVAGGRDPRLEVACPAEAVVAGRRVDNVDDAEREDGPLPAAVGAGCATTLATLGAELGAEALTAAAERLGAGTDPVVPLVANGFSFPAPVDAGDAAVSAAGQGRTEVSPLHLASIAAASTSGRWWPPHLLEEDAPTRDAARTLAPGTLDGLAQLWSGSGTPLDAPGLRGLAGPARGSDGATHAWFVGTVEDLGVAVLVEGEDGTAQAAGLASRFARELAALADAPVDETG